MARRGFFGRIRQVLHAVFPVVPAKKPRREPPEPPREEPRRRRPAPTSGRYGPLEQVWIEETLRRPDAKYRNHIAFMRGLYGFDQLDAGEQEDIWREYVKFSSRGAPRRDDPRNPFYRKSGIPMSRFDWQQWRAVMDKAGTP